jgi:hypothetical protein
MKTYSLIISSFLLLFFCNVQAPEKEIVAKEKNKNTPLKHPKFKSYWYTGKAEITSYKLTQMRYGEVHEGTAVHIYVTEDFLPKKQVKADSQSAQNIPILKLNSTKKFVTGIYPYSIMTSTFSPIAADKQALKISFSAQEWCGNTFIQLNNRDNFEVDFHSYFQNNADRKQSLKKEVLENDLWNQLRISPETIPTGTIKIIPSFEFLALHHREIKSYTAVASFKEVGNSKIYNLNYPELNRMLTIKISAKFPYYIQSWRETLTKNGKTLTTKGEKINTILSAYWTKNGLKNTAERKALGL